MNAITRYVLKQLVGGMILVTLGLACIIWLSQSLRFIEMIVNRGLSAGKFFYLTILLLPNFFTIILPIALFTVVIFTYSKMVTDRELVVMRAAGMSQLALARPALLLALLTVATGYFLNTYLLPLSYRAFRELQWDIRYNYSHVMLQEGAFNAISKDITVYLRERGGDGQLRGVLVHDARNRNRPLTVMAARGALIEEGGTARVVMFDGNRQEVDRRTNSLSVLYFDRYSIDLESTKTEDVARYREPRERTMDELRTIEQDASLPPRDFGKFRVEYHKRLIAPWYPAVFTVVGLACLISGSITRRGQTRRIVAAAALVIVLQAVFMGLENVAARQPELIPAMYPAAVLPLIVGWLLLAHPPRGRRLVAALFLRAN